MSNPKLDFFLSNFLIHPSYLPVRKCIFGAGALNPATDFQAAHRESGGQKGPLCCGKSAI
jgi:hypothetical protein